MPDRFVYLLVDAGAILVPLIFSFHPRIRFVEEWKAFWSANLVCGITFMIWDALFTNLGVWGFNQRYVLGPTLFQLPIEEILFFICIPYSSVFTYFCFKKFFPLVFRRIAITVSLALIVFLLFVGSAHIDKLYTAVTFFVLAAFLLAVTVLRNLRWMHTFYLMYLVILLPFFLVNGVLTGSGLEEPVVWYNDEENMGLRLFTIPAEDLFYGMLLLLSNVFLFERFSLKRG